MYLATLEPVLAWGGGVQSNVALPAATPTLKSRLEIN